MLTRGQHLTFLPVENLTVRRGHEPQGRHLLTGSASASRGGFDAGPLSPPPLLLHSTTCREAYATVRSGSTAGIRAIRSRRGAARKLGDRGRGKAGLNGQDRRRSRRDANQVQQLTNASDAALRDGQVSAERCASCRPRRRRNHIPARRVVRLWPTRVEALLETSIPITQFKTAWLELQVTRTKFVAQSINGSYEEPLTDLVISVFTLLEHTPIQAVGMNREVQLEFVSEDQWHAFGHRVAPKDAWAELLDHPGLVSMQMQGRREGEGNAVNVIISHRGKRRTDIDVNEHRVLENGNGAIAVELLRREWRSAHEGSGEIARKLLELT